MVQSCTVCIRYTPVNVMCKCSVWFFISGKIIFSMVQSPSTAEITEAGKHLTEAVTEELFTISDNPDRASVNAWPWVAEEHGFRWNLSSGTRVVGGLPEKHDGDQVVDGPHQYVLKISKNPTSPLNDYTANYIESTIWEQAVDDGFSHLFAPVVAHGEDYRWIVMEEVEAISDDSWKQYGPVPYNRGEISHSKCEQFRESIGEISEDYGGEMGVDHSGSVVAVDYAHIEGTRWAGMRHPDKLRNITPKEVKKRKRLQNASGLKALSLRILHKLSK